jgi:hypothetical protein
MEQQTGTLNNPEATCRTPKQPEHGKFATEMGYSNKFHICGINLKPFSVHMFK